jgi:hypothetical protein
LPVGAAAGLLYILRAGNIIALKKKKRGSEKGELS